MSWPSQQCTVGLEVIFRHQLAISSPALYPICYKPYCLFMPGLHFSAPLIQKKFYCHFQTALFIIPSNFSTSEIATSYTIKGHLMHGETPNCKHHNFYLPGKKVFSMLLIALIMKALHSTWNCTTCISSSLVSLQLNHLTINIKHPFQ